MSKPSGSDAKDRQAIRTKRFRAMLDEVVARNTFYRSKFATAGLVDGKLPGVDRLADIPFTTKSELVADQSANPPFGSNLTYDLSKYTRVHQTSGTTSSPLRWLDTPESWKWWLDCWSEVYRAAGVGKGDRIFIAFSFGPFIGLWTAFEAGQRLRAMVIPGGGLTTAERLDLLLDHHSTVLVCSPTYALRMADVARNNGFDLASGPVRVTIHGGEPGAGIPNVKARIEQSWGAKCYDHAGGTEVGAWGIGCGHDLRMHVNEDEFLAEVVDPDGDALASVADDGLCHGELVLTNLGRTGSPLIRYRTGDLVAVGRSGCACGRDSVFLQGGILGRVDEMLLVRGVPVFPSAIEDLVRSVAEIDEFEVELATEREMQELIVRIEVPTDLADDVATLLGERFRKAMSLRPKVVPVRPGSLPRPEIADERFKLVEA